MAHLFVLNLRKWRKKAGLSQKELAERCNAAHSYIRQLETGSGYPSFVFIEKLASALSIEPYMLFYDEAAKIGREKAGPDIADAIKNDFLVAIGREIDAVIDKLMASPAKAALPPETLSMRED